MSIKVFRDSLPTPLNNGTDRRVTARHPPLSSFSSSSSSFLPPPTHQCGIPHIYSCGAHTLDPTEPADKDGRPVTLNDKDGSPMDNQQPYCARHVQERDAK